MLPWALNLSSVLPVLAPRRAPRGVCGPAPPRCASRRRSRTARPWKASETRRDPLAPKSRGVALRPGATPGWGGGPARVAGTRSAVAWPEGPASRRGVARARAPAEAEALAGCRGARLARRGAFDTCPTRRGAAGGMRLRDSTKAASRCCRVLHRGRNRGGGRDDIATPGRSPLRRGAARRLCGAAPPERDALLGFWAGFGRRGRPPKRSARSTAALVSASGRGSRLCRRTRGPWARAVARWRRALGPNRRRPVRPSEDGRGAAAAPWSELVGLRRGPPRQAVAFGLCWPRLRRGRPALPEPRRRSRARGRARRPLRVGRLCATHPEGFAVLGLRPGCFRVLLRGGAP